MLSYGNQHGEAAGMLDAIVQTFLNDAVNTGLVLLGKIFRHILGRHFDPNPASFGELAGLPL